MGVPTVEEVRRLAEWRPPHGVISLYLGFDPSDRGGGAAGAAWWRDGAAAVLARSGSGDRGLRAARRALDAFAGGPPRVRKPQIAVGWNRAVEEAQMATGSKSGIPVTLLRHCRAVLSRKTDPRGKVVWVAEVPDMPWCCATGSSRIEALDRVREMGERRRDDERIGRRLAAKRAEPGAG